MTTMVWGYIYLIVNVFCKLLQKQSFDQSIDDLLTQLDEYMGLLDVVSSIFNDKFHKR